MRTAARVEDDLSADGRTVVLMRNIHLLTILAIVLIVVVVVYLAT